MYGRTTRRQRMGIKESKTNVIETGDKSEGIKINFQETMAEQ